MSFSLARLERIYLQPQTEFGTLPNTGGIATVGNANACRFIKATLKHKTNTITREDKTGTRTKTAGTKGRGNGEWSVEMSLAPNGVPAIKPDCAVILEALCGQAGQVTTATAANGFPTGTGVAEGAQAVKYALADSVSAFAFWDFRQPSTINQRVGVACVVNRATFNVGQDSAATWSADGESMGMLTSNQFATADAVLKAALTAFPAEPSAPVTNGDIIPGFVGKAMVGGNTLVTLRNATVEVQSGNVTVKDTFGAFLPTEAEGDGRTVTHKISVYEDDSAAFAALEAAATAKTPLEVIYVIGTVPGSMVVIHSKGVQLDEPDREEERRFSANFNGTASGSSLSARDEITIWFV
ncbi:phage tail tube protein [uncultured Paludibaculum sp.]|uniref:phage tail tube protein n=1 Tax=uncultured Paludibaculum sp. TaxID=1765020 RepID=UPI002AAC3E35|nr:hypothetical protein [uncultured Paludibaculum sp.]